VQTEFIVIRKLTSMKQQRLPLVNELIIDNFAGGGGASTGIEMGFARLGLCREVAVAINHDGEALAMHAANHPGAKHYKEDVYDVHPGFVTRNQPIGLAWFSPTCTHFSRAKGGPLRNQKIRGLAWVTLKWAAFQTPRVIMLENVNEFKDWGPIGEDGKPDKAHKGRTFQAFVLALSSGLSHDHPDMDEIYDALGADFPIQRLIMGLGYAVEWRSLVASDYGAPTTRERLFLVARKDGLPIVWPLQTHAKRTSIDAQSGRLPSWRAASECIDWSIPTRSIFERKKPLAEATLRRIARGLQKFVIDCGDPFIVKFRYNSDGQSIHEPLPTITAGGNAKRPAGAAHALGFCKPVLAPFVSTYYGDKGGPGVRGQAMCSPLATQTTENRHALAVPVLVQTGYGERQGQQPRCLDVQAPLGTVVAGGNKHALVMAFLAQHNKARIGYNPGRSVTDPLSTITATGSQQQLVTAHLVGIDNKSNGASGAWSSDSPLTTITTENRHALVTSNLIKFRGDNIGQSVDEPLATVSAQGNHHAEVRAFLIKYYGNDGHGQSLENPLHTIRTNDCFGLVTVKGDLYQIVDIQLRMLTPRELARAQGFPESYELSPIHNGKPLSKSAQVRMIGNSVSPFPAAALVAANFEHEVMLERAEAA
jgi:DNA (cytosine-5)-methyltransferase 1